MFGVGLAEGLARKRGGAQIGRHMHFGDLHIGGWLGPALIGGVVLFQVYVTYRLWRSNAFEKAQKVAQSKLVWLLPMLGAVIVFSVLMDEEKHARGDTDGGTHLRS